MVDFGKEKVKCLFVQPSFSKYSALNYVDVCNIMGASYSMPPLGLLTVAALLPQNWEFKLIDINVEELSDEHILWADLVCTGGILSQQKGILSIIIRVQKLGKKIVVGGPDPTCQPDIYSNADFLVIGEGENTIPYLIDDLKNGRQSGVYKSEGLVDLVDSVLPRYDLIDFKDYIMMGVQFSRGCPYNCEYCNVIELFGRKPRNKSTESIINELESLYNLGYRGHIFFVDDNFFGNRKHVEELLVNLRTWLRDRKYPFYFGAEATLNFANDDKLLQLIKDIDFRFLSIGIETPDTDLLNSVNKIQNTNLSVKEVIKKVYSYGIVADASFILGFDHEDSNTAKNLVNCIQESGICMAMVGTLHALPKTKLEVRLRKEGRLFEEGTTIRNEEFEIDQMSNGLNFITDRPRLDILRDYLMVVNELYNPENYYRRVTYMGLNLKRVNKYKPNISELLIVLRAFLRLSRMAGFSGTTGLLYWKLFFTILFRNPRALEMSLSMATLYIHFFKHKNYIIELINKKIGFLELHGEDVYQKNRLTSNMELIQNQ